ncbi:MAG TPA: NHLP leader peptide family RiPP precursor [Lacipirellulaceae bacterium]|jgi:hypothetical protein|nr:NHLP leader peptide family RiPP precursor [Lacipirellulaceae bacterium]
MNDDEQSKKIGQLIAKAWADDRFKTKLLSDPVATLKAEGVALPHGLQLRAVENTDKLVYFVIPARPTELSEEDLEKAAGGTIGCKQPPCVTSIPACIILPGK